MAGGAWKVAYADFVTAMMALFMVLWICGQDKKVVEATSQYFKDPFRSPMNATSGVLPLKRTSQGDGREQGADTEKDRSGQVQLTFLSSVAAELYRLLHLEKDSDENPIDVQVTSDGLRITLFDRAKRPLFVSDTAELTEWGKFSIQNLAWLIDNHHFRVAIDGHTRARIAFQREDYSEWELSTDRANSARRGLVHYAVDAALIERVTGYADTRPLKGERPESEANQRITLSLSVSTPPQFKDSTLVDKPVPVAKSIKESGPTS